MANANVDLLAKALLGHACVTSAVVVTLPPPLGGATVGVVETDEYFSSPLLREYANAQCPGHGRLDAVLVVDRIPVTDGRPDVERIGREVSAQAESILYAEASNAAELKLVEMWQAALGQPRIGVNDDFLDLGGDSLVTMSLLYEINAHFGVELDVTELTDASSVRGIARLIEQRGGTR